MILTVVLLVLKLTGMMSISVMGILTPIIVLGVVWLVAIVAVSLLIGLAIFKK